MPLWHHYELYENVLKDYSTDFVQFVLSRAVFAAPMVLFNTIILMWAVYIGDRGGKWGYCIIPHPSPYRLLLRFELNITSKLLYTPHIINVWVCVLWPHFVLIACSLFFILGIRPHMLFLSLHRIRKSGREWENDSV